MSTSKSFENSKLSFKETAIVRQTAQLAKLRLMGSYVLMKYGVLGKYAGRNENRFLCL